MPNKQEEKRYSFPESLVSAVGAYLRRRPWEEVEVLIHALQDMGEEVVRPGEAEKTEEKTSNVTPFRKKEAEPSPDNPPEAT